MASETISPAESARLDQDLDKEFFRLRDEIEPAAEKRWSAANPEKSARYFQLLGELEGAPHLDHHLFLRKSINTKIAIRGGIGVISLLGAGYAAVYGIARYSEPSRISSQFFTKKSERLPAFVSETGPDSFLVHDSK